MKNKGKLYSTALALSLLVFVFLILASAASAAQVTKVGNGSDPAVYGNKVVWADSGVIHVYDLTARTDTIVDSSAASNPDIYRNILVWHDNSSGTPRLAVYDISTAAKTYITKDVDSWSKPAIYGNRIVWSANGGVYMRDISTSTQTRVTDGTDPDIYDTKIAYSYDGIDAEGIYVYDILTNETILARHRDGNLYRPHIYGNKVIWSDFYTRMGYISMYNIDTKETIDVTSDNTGNTLIPDAVDAGDDTGTHIDINGDKIVYSKSGDDQFGYAGVYVYDIPTGQSTPIYNNPREVYTTPDVYGNIVVWGFDTTFGSGTSDKGIYVYDLAAESTIPAADFSANVTSGAAPLVVLFTDTSTGLAPASWLWDFGDGITSEHAMNATHTFTKPGNYNVSLTMKSATNNATVMKGNYIIVTDPAVADPNVPIANFGSNTTEGYAPLTVQFYDYSQKGISRIWDFNNDGQADSVDTNPVYVYTAPGTYTVNLKVSNANGTTSNTAIITVKESSSSDGSDSNGGSSHSSGGSSGGAGGSPEPAKNVEVKELSQVFITSGKKTEFNFTKNVTCVVYVSFDAKKTLGKTTAIAEMLKGTSTLVSELPAGEVYKSFNVWVGNGGVASSKNIENPVVCFKVEKSWLQNKSIDPASITLNWYNGEKWEQFPVNCSGEDEKFLYFTANVSGYSSFAITGTEKNSDEITTGMQPESETGAINKNNTTSAELEGGQEKQKESQSAPGFEVESIVACVLCLSLFKRIQEK